MLGVGNRTLESETRVGSGFQRDLGETGSFCVTWGGGLRPWGMV